MEERGKYLKHKKHSLTDQINVKLSPEAKAGLRALAEAHNLSLNAFLNELGTGNLDLGEVLRSYLAVCSGSLSN